MINTIPYGTLRDIADELKNIREILEKQQSTEVSEDNEPTWEQTDYCCPNCGSKMKGAEE